MIASGALDQLRSIASNELTTDYYNKLIQAIGLRRDREAFTTLFNSLAPKVMRWRRLSAQFGGLAKVGSGSDHAASLRSGVALSGASPG